MSLAVLLAVTLHAVISNETVAFRWRIWKIQMYAEASWVLKKKQKIRGCQRETSGISDISLAAPNNLFNVLNN